MSVFEGLRKEIKDALGVDIIELKDGYRIVTQSIVCKIPPGKWWFGDPCYVMSDEDYNAMGDLLYPPGNSSGSGPKATRDYVVGNTAHGDGSYTCSTSPYDSSRVFHVDSGLLGLLSKSKVDESKLTEYLSNARGLGMWFELPEGGLFEVAEDHAFILKDNKGKCLLFVTTDDMEYDEEDDEEDDEGYERLEK